MDYQTYLTRCKDLAAQIDQAEAVIKANTSREDIASFMRLLEARRHRDQLILTRDRMMGNYWGSQEKEI